VIVENKKLTKYTERTHCMNLNDQSSMVQSLDENGNIIEVSPAWLEKTGYDKEEVIGRFFGDFLDEECVVQIVEGFPHLKDYGFVDNVPLAIRRKDGVMMTIAINGTSRYDKKGNFERTFCEIRTLDYYMNSVNAIQKLLEKERFQNTILSIKSNISLLALSENSIESIVNNVKIILKEAVEIVNCQIISKVEDNIMEEHETVKAFRKLAKEQHLSENTHTITLRANEFSNKSLLNNSTTIILISKIDNSVYKNKELYMIIELNISEEFINNWAEEISHIACSLQLLVNNIFLNIEQINLIKQLEELSVTDKLTRLYNRVKVDEELKKQMHNFKRYGCHCSIILIDIDNFKEVNDKHGHLTGDNVIIELANILKYNTRKNDIVGRWGGEEFLIICPNTDIKNTATLAEKLRKSFEVRSYKNITNQTISIGVSCFTENLEINQVLENADRALYRSKTNGKNQVSVASLD